MGQLLIQGYFNEISRLKKFSGTATEGVISEAFKDLLKAWARRSDYGRLRVDYGDSLINPQLNPRRA